MFFAQNIKLLRQKSKMSQDQTAMAIGVKRTSLTGYESGSAEPTYDTLIKLSTLFKVPLDALLKKDLSILSEKQLEEIQEGKLDLKGVSLRVLATTVDSNNIDNIELVPVKAKAGYTAGFADPDYIKVLQTFNLPFLDRKRKYRTFQISGDSMPPVNEGSWVTGEYLDNWNYIKDRYPYIIVTKDEGVVFKIVYNKIRENGTLQLCSTNPAYEPYEVSVNDILEVWKFTNYISSELPEPNLSKDELAGSVFKLQREMSELKNTFKKKPVKV